MLDAILADIERSQPQSIQGLIEFLRMPTVSTKPEHAADCRACAQWLADLLKKSGLWARIEPTRGHPLVLAGTPRRADRPTVLVYGHYDVQPPEPMDQWISPPFAPTIRRTDAGTDAIYARGAADDKGQVWAHLQAIRAWASAGDIPVNLILLIEGEEEIGSENLEHWVRTHTDDLRADIGVVSDTGGFARGVPAITYGLRGLCYMEVVLTGPSHDLHSGIHGGAVPNPGNILCELLATLHTPDGKVNIPGFYDDVVPLTDAERAMWRRLALDERKYAADLGVGELMGEAGYSTLERRWARPTCDVNGLTSGYQGHGAKTIIPSRASAKVSMRLVPNHNAARIRESFEQTLRQRCPRGVRIEFSNHGLCGAAMVPADSPATKLAARAVEIGYGKAPVLMREGGTVPIVGLLKSVVGLDSLMVGFGLPDDRVHSPNEKFDLDALRCGTRTVAALYKELAAL